MASKKKGGLAAEWQTLHGFPLPDAAAKLAPSAEHELEGMRPAGLLEAPNLFEATLAATEGWRRLLLWQPFASVLPMHPLGNGDVLHVFVPSPTQQGGRPAIVVWDHERDVLDAPRPGELEGLPPGDPATPLRFCARALHIVDTLVRGRFDLDVFLGFEHAPIDPAHPQLVENLKRYPPSALYSMWHLFFAKEDAKLARVLELAEQSTGRWIRDSAALVRELLAGRNELGAMKDVRAVRDQAAALIADPAVRERAAAKQRRASLDGSLANLPGCRLIRTDGSGTPSEARTETTLSTGLQLTVTTAGPRTSLVLRHEGRSLDAITLAGDGGPNKLDAGLHALPGDRVALTWRSRPGAPMFPRDGQLQIVGVLDRRLVRLAAFAFDLDGLERDGDALVARTLDGARYRMEGEPRPQPPRPIPPIPGSPAQPPVSPSAPEIDGDRIELTRMSLRVHRGEQLLYEEPMVETYAMAVVPTRRMVAVHRADFELRPVIDVFFVRRLDGPVGPGEGGCSWVTFAVDGHDVALHGEGDRLFVAIDGAWCEIDRAVLDAVPSWIKARGWV